MIQDVRFAIRSLAAARGFTTAALLTLGLGIAATTIVYAVVDALLLRPDPFGPRSARLVTLHSTHPTQAQDWDDSELSYPDLHDVRERSRTLEAVEGAMARNVSLSAGQEAERVRAASITPGLFELLGVQPQIGRAFTTGEGAAPGFETVAIVSDGLWRRVFGGDPDVTRRTLFVNGRSLAIVGVMPPHFGFPYGQDVWLPYRAPLDTGRAGRDLFSVGLRREGVTLEAVREDVRAIAASLATEYPAANRGWGIHVMPIREFFVGAPTRRSVGAMLAAVCLVLLIGCANVASLLVARGVARQRELTVRAALGSGRARLVRLLMAESLVLAVGGGALGLLLGTWGLEALVVSNTEPPPYWAAFRIDGRVVAFAAGLSVLTSILCGLVPALRASRVDVSPGALQSGRSGGAARAQRRTQGLLVTGQVAVSLALLVAATLLARSTLALQHADLGFDDAGLMSLRIYMAGNAYDDPVARARGLARVVERITALPGAGAVAATGAIPGDDGGEAIRLMPDGGVATPGEEIGGQAVPITPRFFETLGLSLVEGRTFTLSELEDPRAAVAIVNRRLADVLWRREGSAVGRVLRVAEPSGFLSLRVVGVAPDLVYEELGEESAQSKLTVYVPYARAGWRSMALLVRGAASAADIRRALHDVDRAFAAYDVMSMAERRVFTMWGERFLGRTFGLFAIAAVLLACVGAYGLTAYSAAQRTREIGVRMAIGATRRDVVRLLLRRDAGLALLGILAGVPVAIAAARLLQSLLFEVSPWNPGVWLVTPLVLLAAIFVASVIPARRASLADPAEALRAE